MLTEHLLAYVLLALGKRRYSELHNCVCLAFIPECRKDSKRMQKWAYFCASSLHIHYNPKVSMEFKYEYFIQELKINSVLHLDVYRTR